jgi:GAF domain-containing protein
MGAIKIIKNELVSQIAAISTINKVYDHEKLNPTGFPCAFVTFAGSDNEFYTNAENKRIHSYRVLVLAQIGQDRDNTDRVELAEQAIEDITGDILDALDSNITLDDNTQLVFMEAAIGTPGYFQYEAGWARGIEITVKVHSIYIV